MHWRNAGTSAVDTQNYMVMPSRFVPKVLSVVVAAVLVSAGALDAQTIAGAPSATRAELETALGQRELWAASTAYGTRLRSQARREASLIRDRLREGDFRVGDRMLLRVEGAVPFNDTVTVQPGPRIIVPGLEAVDVTGTLRSELSVKLQGAFRRTVLDAKVAVQPLARVAVFGAVASPGYQLVPFESRVDELLMSAGGPVGDTRPNRFSIMRGDTVLVDADDVATAIAAGRTLGELSMRDGDYLTVKPISPPWDRGTVLSVVGIFAAPLLTAILLR